MLEAVAIQIENNRRQQEQIRKDFYRYSDLAAGAKIQLMQLTKAQIHLGVWGCRNAILQEKKNTDAESIGRCTGTQQSDEKTIGRDSEKGEKGS